MDDWPRTQQRLICGNAPAFGGFVEPEAKELRAALDAAQDEIERLISEQEALRAERDMLRAITDALSGVTTRTDR